MKNKKPIKLKRILEILMIGLIGLNICIAFAINDRSKMQNHDMAEVTENCDTTCHNERLKASE